MKLLVSEREFSGKHVYLHLVNFVGSDIMYLDLMG